MSPTLERDLQTVENRLEEVLSAFAISRTLNETCNADVNEPLNAIVNSRGAYWQTVLNAAQTTHFLGIIALLDKYSDESATLYSLHAEAEVASPGLAPSNLVATLDTIRARYAKFRNKLFGHNDRKRAQFAANFDAAGFTWTAMADDLDSLDYAFKVLYEILNGRTVPTKDQATKMRFPYSMGVEQVRKNTLELLDDLQR